MQSYPILRRSILVVTLILTSRAWAVDVDTPFTAVRDALSDIMPTATLRFHSLPNGVVLRGTVASPQDVKLVEQIAQSYFPTVINEIETAIVRGRESSVDRKAGDIVKGEGAERLNTKLQEIYPTLRLSTVAIPNAAVLFGEVDPSRDIKTIVKIAEQYFPKVINAISVADVSSNRPASTANSRNQVSSMPPGHIPRTGTSEIDQLRAEVQGLREDVRQLIRLLEADGREEKISTNALDKQRHYKIKMGVDGSRMLQLERADIQRVLVSNPELLNALATAPNKIQLVGLKAGETQVKLWDAEGKLYTIDAVVHGDARDLEDLLKTEFPNSSLRVRTLSDGIVLSGTVRRPESIRRVIDLAEDFAPKVINNIRVNERLAAVVSIQGREKPLVNGSQRQVYFRGAGVIIDERGYIVTSYQIVQRMDRIEVSMPGGQKLDGRLVGNNSQTDLAIIKVNCDKPLPVMPIATSSHLMAGDPVAVVGNPYGYENSTVLGTISALNRSLSMNNLKLTGLIQTDVSPIPGISGGPLLNEKGELIGVTIGVRENSRGVLFAVPSDEVLTVISKALATSPH